MALSLAACGSSDDTSDAVSYSQAQLDAAKAAATSAAEASAATAATAAAATAATAQAAAVSEAETTAATAQAAAVAAVDTTVDDAAAVSLALRDAAANLSVSGTSTMTDAELVTAIKQANDADVASKVDTTADDAAAINAAVLALGYAGVTTLAQLNTAYDTLLNPVVTKFTLTAGMDTGSSFVGSSSDDTYDGSTSNYLSSGDSLDGGDGSDSLTATLATASIGFTSKNIETINITGITGDSTLDMINVSGLTNLGSISSTMSLTFNNLISVPTLTVNSDAAAKTQTFNFRDSAITSATDDLTINVNNASGTIALTKEAGSTGKIETVSLNGQTSASTITDLQTTGVGTTKLEVTGTADVAVTAALDNEIVTVSAGDATGDVSLVLGTGGVTATMGAGADTITAGSGVDSISGGGGNDTINIAAANLAKTDSLDGQGGTDTLSVSSDITLADTTFTALSNIETLTTAANIDLDGTLGANAAAAGIATVTFAGAAALDTDTLSVGVGFTNNLTVNFDSDANAANSVTASAYTGALTVKASANELDSNASTVTGSLTGTSDKLEVSANASVTSLLTSVTNVETVSIVDGDATTAHTVTIAAVNAGSTYTSATDYQTITFDASALTDDIATIDGTLEVDAKVTIKGGGAADVITSSASANFGDTITGGAGNDTINFATANLTSADSVDGGDGTDTLKMITADATVVDADFTNVTNVEVIQGGSAVLDLDVTLDTLADAAGIRTVNLTDAGSTGDVVTIKAGFTSALTIDLDGTSTAGSTVDASAYVGAGLTLKADAAEIFDAGGVTNTITGSAGTDVLEVSVESATTTTIQSGMTGIETIRIVDGETGTNRTMTFTHADETSAFTNSSVYETVTIDMSAIGASGDTVNVTLADETDAGVKVIGGAGVNTITMSQSTNVGDDIDAAGGDDTIVSNVNAGTAYLTATDTVKGGAGNDTLSFSADATVVDSSFTLVTGVETVTASADKDLDITLGALASAAGVTAVTLTGTAASDTDSVTVGSGFTTALTVNLDSDANEGNTVTATGYTGALTVKAASGEVDTTASTITGGSGTSDKVEVSLAGDHTVIVTGITKVETISVIDGNTASNHTATITLADANADTASETITVDGSALVGDILTASAASENDATVVIKGGGADDVITASTSANAGDTLTGGAGNDTFNISNTGFTSADTIDGGAGTADVISLSDDATVVDADFTKVTNVETLTGAANKDVDTTLGALANASGLTAVTFAGAAAGDTDTLTIGAGFSNNLTVNFDSDANVANSVTATNYTGDLTIAAADDALDTTASTMTGGTGTNDILEVTLTTGNDTILTTNMTNIETIKTKGALGNMAVTLVDGNVTSGKTLSINALSMDDDILTVDASAETDGAVSIQADGTGDHQITLGYGNDTYSSTSTADEDVTATAGNNTISTGDGADTITLGTGSDTVNSQNGNDIIQSASANLGGTDTIDGGAGTDVLTMTDDSVVTDADFTKVTNVETLTSAANKDLTATVGAAASSAGLATITLTGAAAADTDTVTVGSGFATALTVNLDSDANAGNTVTATGYSGVLTVAAGDDELDSNASTITGGSGTGDILEVTLTTGDDTILLTSVTAIENINTKGALGNVTMTTVENNVANGKTLTVDATSMDGDVLTFDGSAEGAATTSVGNFVVKADGTGNHAITLGAGADTVTLTGSGTTTVTGTAGANSITTGTGADTITAGSGTDTIAGGTGSDTFAFGSVTNALNDSITDFVSADDTLQVTLDYSSLLSSVVVNGARTSAGVAGKDAAEATLTGQRGEFVYDTTNSMLYVNNTADGSISSADFKVSINAAATAANTIAANDINFVVKGTSGADTLLTSTGVDNIDGNAGADTITGGTGLDTFVFNAGDSAVTIGGSGDAGTITGFDTITDFADATSGANSETIDISGTAAFDATSANGTDSTLTIGGTAVKSHSVADGLVTFDDADIFAGALTIDSTADVAAVIQYLQAQDLGDNGDTLMFNVADNTFAVDSGTVTDAVVFTQGSDAGTDNSLDLVIVLLGTGAVDDLMTTNATNAGDVMIA
jgi:Ca2+-binding RTX toxin-like protein